MLLKFLLIILFFMIAASGFSQEFNLLSPPVIDLGTALGDTVLEGKVRFSNSGHTVMVINRVQTSCGCTATQLEKMSYEPGEEGEIVVRFNTKGQHTGLVRKYVNITMEAGKPATVRITLQANLKEYVQIEPAFIDFQNISLSTSSYQRIMTVTNNYDRPLIIKGMQTNIPVLKIENREYRLKSGTSVEIVLHVEPVKEGRNDGYVDLNFSEPVAQSKRVPVFMKVIR